MAKAKPKKPAAKPGRPSAFTQALADEICEAIALGAGLREALRANPHWPNEATIYRWLDAHDQFRKDYVRARERQADAEFDEVKTLADNATDANIARLQIDARKWRAGKMRPKVYGDKVQTEVSGPEGGPIETVELTPREVAQRAAFLLAKGAKAK